MSTVDQQDDKPSIRRRFTTLKTSLKRVMSSTSDKSLKSPTKSIASPKASTELTKTLSGGEPSKAASAPAKKTDTKAKKPAPGPPPPVVAPAERAQALFKKYGLDIKTEDWPVRDVPAGEREHKEIRMRVHRSCHRCAATFGPEKECRNCTHKRCKKCPRFPAKRAQESAATSSKPAAAAKPATKITDPKELRAYWESVGYKKRKGDYTYGITLPSKTGGHDLVRKPVRQRVHRTCHRCGTDFAGEKLCNKCNHTRCKKCPREPKKANKPPGYYDKYDPSDSEPEKVVYAPRPRKTYRRPRMRVHWTCTECKSSFQPKNKVCPGCSKHRDDVGERYPPKKDKHKKNYPSDAMLERLSKQLQQAEIKA